MSTPTGPIQHFRHISISVARDLITLKRRHVVYYIGHKGNSREVWSGHTRTRPSVRELWRFCCQRAARPSDLLTSCFLMYRAINPDLFWVFYDHRFLRYGDLNLGHTSCCRCACAMSRDLAWCSRGGKALGKYLSSGPLLHYDDTSLTEPIVLSRVKMHKNVQISMELGTEHRCFYFLSPSKQYFVFSKYSISRKRNKK